jgi:hypothetical protein
MDPDAYRSFNNSKLVMVKLPPYIPVSGESSGHPDEASAQQKPADTGWTGNSLNFLGRDMDEMDVGQNNAATFVGSRAEISKGQKVTDATPWMSATQQQPFKWTGGWTDEA